MVTFEHGDVERSPRKRRKLQVESVNRRTGRRAARTRAVTAARLEDVGRPTVSPASASAKPPVAGDASRPLAAAPGRASLHDAARSAHRGAVQLLDSLARLASQFRRGELAAADRDFSALIRALRALTRVTAILVDIAGTPELRNRLDAVAGRLSGALDAIAASRTDHQWWAVANLLEGQVAQALDQWTTILGAISDGGQEPAEGIGAGVADAAPGRERVAS
jgi:hypothetical protein